MLKNACDCYWRTNSQQKWAHLGSVGLIENSGRICSGISMVGLHLLANGDQILKLLLFRGVKDARRCTRIGNGRTFYMLILA